jgi:hypothetical protein
MESILSTPSNFDAVPKKMQRSMITTLWYSQVCQRGHAAENTRPMFPQQLDIPLPEK